MAQYRTRSGDMVDAICSQYYDSIQAKTVEKILEANRGLADLGPILPAGIIIELPDLPPPDITPSIKLWD